MVTMDSRPETALGIGGRRPREESEIHPNYKSAPENGEHRNKVGFVLYNTEYSVMQLTERAVNW